MEGPRQLDLTQMVYLVASQLLRCTWSSRLELWDFHAEAVAGEEWLSAGISLCVGESTYAMKNAAQPHIIWWELGRCNSGYTKVCTKHHQLQNALRSWHPDNGLGSGSSSLQTRVLHFLNDEMVCHCRCCCWFFAWNDTMIVIEIVISNEGSFSVL